MRDLCQPDRADLLCFPQKGDSVARGRSARYGHHAVATETRSVSSDPRHCASPCGCRLIVGFSLNAVASTLHPRRGTSADGVVSEQTSHDLLAVAAQLVEAAWRARDGDSDAVKAHIARAVALLDGHAPVRAAASGADLKGIALIRRGAFAAWQARRLAAHVDANLGAKIYIKDLAAFLDVSVSHFCSAFKRTFGVSAHIWIAWRRIEVAQGLMLTTSSPLSEIALSCGMSDQSHFTRSFRRIVGETPHLWRQARRDAMEEHVTELARTRAA